MQAYIQNILSIPNNKCLYIQPLRLKTVKFYVWHQFFFKLRKNKTKFHLFKVCFKWINIVKGLTHSFHIYNLCCQTWTKYCWNSLMLNRSLYIVFRRNDLNKKNQSLCMHWCQTQNVSALPYCIGLTNNHNLLYTEHLENYPITRDIIINVNAKLHQERHLLNKILLISTRKLINGEKILTN